MADILLVYILRIGFTTRNTRLSDEVPHYALSNGDYTKRKLRQGRLLTSEGLRFYEAIRIRLSTEHFVNATSNRIVAAAGGLSRLIFKRYNRKGGIRNERSWTT